MTHIHAHPDDVDDDDGPTVLVPGDTDTTPVPTVATKPSDLDAVAELAEAHDQILREIEKRIIGQRRVIEQLLVALFARGHTLFVGVPGLAKTLLISTLAETLNLSFQRIQFTPDLMPADITGTEVLEEDHTTGRRVFRFLKGPVFANLVLADEINRTPPKTQAALLQSMQEYRVTAGGTTHDLPLPFLVFATQNPVEQEGTYPLPEAQLDRFMFQVDVDYPSEAEEEEIVRQQTSDHKPELTRVLSPQRITQLQPRASRAGGRSRREVRGRAGARDPADGTHRSRVRQGVGVVGRRPARLAVPDPRRQGTRDPRRAVRSVDRRRRRARPPDPAAPADPQLSRRGRGQRRRAGRPPARSLPSVRKLPGTIDPAQPPRPRSPRSRRG